MKSKASKQLVQTIVRLSFVSSELAIENHETELISDAIPIARLTDIINISPPPSPLAFDL